MTVSNGEGDADERRENEECSADGTAETYTCGQQQRERITSRKINCKRQLLDILKEKSEHTDGDKTFLLSVLHSCQQISMVLKFSKSQTGSDVRYSCHHNSSHFTFPIFAHSCRFSVLHSLQSITPRIY